MKIALLIFAVLLGLAIALELGLRRLFGFGDPLLYIADEKIGYLLAPNQSVKRFGNQIEINQHSMRSADFSSQRPESTLRLFLLGDSIANGGWWTDQQETISALLQRQLQTDHSTFHSTFTAVEVLNASANSWGPRNELAYLQRFGLFDAQTIVLLINTDDLFATAPTSIQVGRDRNYPSHKPPFALAEVFTRYLLKPKPIPELAAIQAEQGDRVGFNLEAIQQIQTLIRQSGRHFLLAMTPLLRELGESGPRDYELQARQRLQDFATTAEISYIDFLPIFNTATQPSALYRDHIHLSPLGNQLVVDHVIDKLQLPQ